MQTSSWRTVATLGAAQTLAWASSYYLPAMLATPMALEFGLAPATIFAAFSVALVVSALVGPWAGRRIDRHGGRPLLMGSSLLFALGLAALGLAQGPVSLFAAWLLLGLAMAGGLYDAAFASLVRLYGQDARRSITGITLIAGFASTVGWPLSTLMEQHWGWRGACLGWAALHLLLGLPLNAWLPRAAPETVLAKPMKKASDGAGSAQASVRAAWILALVFAVAGFVGTAMAAHLPRLLQAQGSSLAAAVAVGALIGPAQVGARLLEYGVLRRAHPLWIARAATAMHPLGGVLLAVFGAPLAPLFGLLHGGGNGILTIVKGTLPLALFGAQGYGQRQGLLMAPMRVSQALSPWLFGLALDRWGGGAIWLTALLGLLSLGGLLMIPARPAEH
ncbi:MFS transporter [Paucibacter sp. APW11]|uniref:MFS transporter n=1 Tax=Roseateles aquae TaxID=3077235 RepID=A0ABU3P8Q2_9BURK|nr:MFS transporter [Paucibacter sp. APW11]MDT8998878.1 MFS transporter [Paucibacter sp. APW11]